MVVSTNLPLREGLAARGPPIARRTFGYSAHICLANVEARGKKARLWKLHKTALALF
jgi:hypothetical protein